MIGTDITSFSFWAIHIYFVISIIIAFYIPGSIFFKRLHLTLLQKLVLATITGITMWGIQGFIFGYLKMRNLSYVYISIFLFIFLKNTIHSKKRVHVSINFRSLDYICIFMIIVGALIQVSGVWFMGIKIASGILTCCGHVPDNNLELAIINEITHRFPPYEPGMYGVYIQNYHYWSHLVIGDLIRVFHLPLIATTYQYMSLFISIGLGLSAVVLSELLLLKKVFIRWFLFFLYFSGELTYVTIFLLTKKIDFSIGSLENSTQFLMNYPRALAILILMGGLSIFVIWLKNKKNYLLYIFCILCGTLIGYKVYVGIFALSGLFSLLVYYLFKRRKEIIFPVITACIISVMIYIPVNYNAGGLFYTGTWRIENFAHIEQFNLGMSVLALEVYKQHNSIIRIIEYETLFFILFAVSSFGLKILGLLQNKKTLAMVPYDFHVYLGGALTSSLILGMLFMQKTGGPNTFNFLVVVIIISSFYAALSVSHIVDIQKSIAIKMLITITIICVSTPRIIYAVNLNIRSISHRESAIENDQIEASIFLRTKTAENSVILVDPRLGLSDYISPTISFLANRPTYYSGVLNELTTHSIDFSGRMNIVNTIFNSNDESTVRKYLKESGVVYLLTSNNGNLTNPESHLTTEVFRNNNFIILEVQDLQQLEPKTK